jgi:hypothetical protein
MESTYNIAMTTNRFTDRNGIEHTEFESDAHKIDLELAAAERQQPKSCLKCTHFKVCTIARNIMPMMEQLYGMLAEKDRPFSADQIAWLCKWYELKKEPEQQQ